MMYILTQKEFDELQLKKKQITKDDQKVLQDLCTRVADSEILTKGWMKGKPWGCIKTKNYEWYCDDCPVRNVCPEPYKEWSK